jgi:putative ABC transport system permease protein
VFYIGWRDLQFRRRRFIIAILATSLVFAIALILSGVSGGFSSEITRSVDSFGAGGWVVPAKAAGPFSNAEVFAPDDVVAGVEGGGKITAMAMARVPRGDKDVMVFGIEPGGLGPEATSGRDAKSSGEVVVDESLGLDVGDELVLGARSFDVVGTYSGRTIFAGSPTAVISLEDAQKLTYAGQPLASALLTARMPTAVPEGFRALTNAQAEADLARPLKAATGTIDFLRVLLWLIAVGIIGSIVYMTVLEQTRDFAVLKAIGVQGRSIFSGLVTQAVIVSVASAAVAALLTLVIKGFVPMNTEISTATYITLPIIAAIAGVAASLVGLRRAVGVDPALAFG